MKKGITIGIALVLAVMVGGLSMGCIDAPVKIGPEVPGVLPSEFNGSEEFNGTTIVVEIVMVENVTSEVEVITYKESYILTYNPYITVMYPENILNWDTPTERAYVNQGKLNKAVEDTGRGEFYLRLYQADQDKYERMYEYVGNTILTDSTYIIERADNITGNGSA